MRKSIGYGITAVLVVLLLGTLVLGKLYSVYNPWDNRNVLESKVSLDDLKAWVNLPEFNRWTNLADLDEYLQEKYDVTLDQLKAQSAKLDRRQLLSLTGRSTVKKKFSTGGFMTSEGEAITEIECDLDDKELTFELTNVGETNWFLIDQALTSDSKSIKYKKLNGPLAEATPIKLYINNFLVNSLSDKYWMGEKLFYAEGKTFADAARADFLRRGKTTKVKLEPIPARTGLLANNYLLVATGFNEKGKFVCE